MPKEECKVASGCKHKERKPKKPHYIPRPFGKPYNYKCFQCPFTCMEKSHLYNHMKYSLCKNSLSLLIESDWPYKKGNLLHTDHLRFPQGVLGPRSPAKEHQDHGVAGEEAMAMATVSAAPAPARNLELSFADDADDCETEDRDVEGGAARTEGGGTVEQSPESASETCPRGATKRAKQEAELVMADVFSLEEQLLRARSVEVEAKLRHYRLSKTCLSGPAALLSEQWHLLSNQTPSGKSKSDSVGGSLPCYPPPLPPGHLDCPDTSSLNLSLLGVGYPLTPGLFSYLNPALGAAATAATNTSTSPAQINPFPFLASAAQLAQNHAASDRALLPPRLYYPFLCEHTLGQAPSVQAAGEPAKAVKSSGVPLDSTYASKLNMWKVPALRPNSGQALSGSWGSSGVLSPEMVQRCGERNLNRDGKAGWVQEQSVKRSAGSLDPNSGPAEKKPMLFQLDRVTPTAATATDRLVHNGHHAQVRLDERYTDVKSSACLSPASTGSSPLRVRDQGEEKERGMERGTEREGESAAALLRDLSSALREYRHAEQRAALLPEQCHLWAHLGKIRSELSHIQQALERTARHSEGPLDLSVKRDPGTSTGESAGHAVTGERKETKDETCSETEEEEEVEEGERDRGATEEEEEGNELKEKRKRSLDILIKLNQSAVSLVKPGVSVVKSEGLACDGLALRAGEAEALWHSRTTKCEADSSVLLCAKTPNRPPSIHHLDTVCPPSPLTTTDA